MKIIKYVYFTKPGEKEKVLEIAANSLDKIGMAGKLMQDLNLSLEDAQITAEKFFKK